MKKSIFLIAGLAAIALFSCSKNDSVDPVTIDKGEPIFAQFTIQLSGATQTRAGVLGDANGTAIENTISDISVFVFEGDVQVGMLTVPAVTNANSQTTDAVKLTSGPKQVVAVVNGTGRITTTPTTTLSALKGMVAAATTDVEDATNVLFTSPVTNVTVPTPIVGAGDAQATPIKLTVGNVARAIAKVVVRPAGTVVGSTVGTVADVQFGINGLRMNAGKIPFYAGNVIANHAASTLERSAAGIANAVTGTRNYVGIAASAADFSTITGDGANGGYYVLENVVPSTGLFQDATLVYVKLKFAPNNTTFTNGDGTPGAQITNGVSYWMVKHATTPTDVKYFASEADCNIWLGNATLANGYETGFKVYTDGINYYPVVITHDAGNLATKFSVLRGNIYNVKLGNVRGHGASTDTDTDIVTPGNPISADAWIDVKVEILNWLVKDINTDL